MFMLTHLVGFGVGQASSTALGISGTPVTATQEDVPYAGFTVTASGGTAPYTYSVFAGTLPTGISLNSSTGAVSGTPTTIGTSTGIVIRVTDSLGATADLAPFDLNVYGDLYWANVVLLVSFDGSDGATSATDDSLSAHSLTFTGNAQLDTGVAPPFGTASLLCDGTGDAVTTPDSADWAFGSGNFTIECFARPRISANADTIISQWSGVTGQLSWSIENNAGIDITARWSFNGSGSFTAGTSGDVFTASTWHHVCMERSGDKLRLYVDGVMAGSATGLSTNAFFDSNLSMFIGGRSDSAAYFDGHIKEIRITKGTARYASDSGFTVPTAAFPRG